MNDQLLTINEAAELLKLNPMTLRRWDKEGKLPAAKINDRGDRRYKMSDIRKFMPFDGSPKTYEYSGYRISLTSSGFHSEQGNFGVLGKYEVVNGDIWTGCAFHCEALEKFRSGLDILGFELLAQTKIHSLIDTKMLDGGIVYTFEYVAGEFTRVWYPSWWEGDTGVLLTEGLQAVVDHCSMVAPRVEAWRCLVNFKENTSGVWIKSPFGPNHEHTEYAVEVSAEYLEDQTDFDASEQGAKSFSLDYIKQRYEATRVAPHGRTIERISESRVACWKGKCVTNGFIEIEN